MMISRFFTMFAGPQHAALMVNAMSALASGATIMFLFWSITHLARRAMRKENELSMPQTIAVIGAGLVGSIAYTFTDTFWFSAVEGRSVRAVVVLYGDRILGDPEMGKRRRRTACEPLADPDRLPYRAGHRRTPAEPTDHSADRTDLLFPQIQRDQMGESSRRCWFPPRSSWRPCSSSFPERSNWAHCSTGCSSTRSVCRSTAESRSTLCAVRPALAWGVYLTHKKGRCWPTRFCCA